MYNNFSNKEALFAEVVRKHCNEAAPTLLSESDIERDPERVLVEHATSVLKSIYTPKLIGIYQTVVAESRKFPKIGQMLFEGPIMQTQDSFDRYFRQQAKLGRMSFPDIDLAAPQFVALLKTNVHMKLTLNQPEDVDERTLKKIARSCVKLFLYGAFTRNSGSRN